MIFVIIPDFSPWPFFNSMTFHVQQLSALQTPSSYKQIYRSNVISTIMELQHTHQAWRGFGVEKNEVDTMNRLPITQHMTLHKVYHLPQTPHNSSYNNSKIPISAYMDSSSAGQVFKRKPKNVFLVINCAKWFPL